LKVSLGYKKEKIEVNIDDKNVLAVLKPNYVDFESADGAIEVRNSILNPIGSKQLCEIVKKGEKIAIITSDITRPVPSYIIIPEIVAELVNCGIDKSDICIVFALGSHRAHTKEEMKKLVSEAVFDEIECVDSDCSKPEDFIYLGETASGTPVEIFNRVVNADRRICVGNIEYHYFAGYSGGAKAIMPGVSTHNAIQKNHSMMVKSGATTGNIATNPVRNDIDDVTKFISIDFIVNVVLNENKKILRAFSGHYLAAHRMGCEFLDSLYKVKIKEKADVVLVSAGGCPKDINLYQAQKALDNSAFAVKDGGVIILVASCSEGLGEKTFERWMTEFTPDEMIVNIKRHFELGGHKAAAISLLLKKADIILVSDLEPDFVSSIHLLPSKSVEEAMSKAMQKVGDNANIIVMPYGGSTLPFFENEI
jgi:nickel-dependent lactate racemase